MRVLVTGAAGFTGQHLMPLLREAGHQVIGTQAPGESGADLPKVDLLDLAAVRDLLDDNMPDAIIHLAARSFVADADIAGLYASNIMGTRNLLEAAAGQPTIRRIILASSGNICAADSDGMIDESALPRPANDYGVSKFAMEQLPGIWPGRFEILIARPFNYTGVGQSERFLIPKIVAAFQARQPVLELGNLEVARDFSDVRDIASAYCGLVTSPVTGIVNLCSGTAVSLRDVIETCAEISGHRLEIRSNPAFVRSNEIPRLLGSNARLRTMMPGWSPRPIRETLQWMLESR